MLTELHIFREYENTRRDVGGMMHTVTNLTYNGNTIEGWGLSVNLVITSKDLRTSYTVSKYNWMGTYDHKWQDYISYTPSIATKPTDRIEYEEDEAVMMSISLTPAIFPSSVRWYFWDGRGARVEQPPIFKQQLHHGEGADDDQVLPLEGAEGDVTYEGSSLISSISIPHPDVDIHTGQYSLSLSYSLVSISHMVDVLPRGQHSTFPTRGLELEVSASDYQFISSDNRRLEFLKGGENAIQCRASGMMVGAIEILHSGRILVGFSS